jgi:hypothetical protein
VSSQQPSGPAAEESDAEVERAIDDAPINPQTGVPEPTLTYVGEDDEPAH